MRRELLERYGLFIMLLVIPALIVVIAPRREDAATPADLAPPGAALAPGAFSDTAGTPEAYRAADGGLATTARNGQTAPRGAATSPQRVAACPQLGAVGITGLGSGGIACGTDHREQGIWPWSAPWLLTGDRAACGKDGLLDENVTSWSIACTPKFHGDNGGATYQGVTRNKIVAVRYAAKYSEAEEALLRSQGIWISDAQARDALKYFGDFLNKHTDLYGRDVEWHLVKSTCNAADEACFRGEAKQIVTKYKPFFVFSEDGKVGFDPEFFDELSRRKLFNMGARYLAPSFNAARRPYHWDNNMDGEGVVRQIAEYWCKRMAGKKATLAGSASIRSQRRKLGIAVQETPGIVDQGKRLAALVSGEMCGTKADEPVLVTHSASTETTAQQASPMVVKFMQKNVTTVVGFDALIVIFGTRAMDQQRYFPEHLMAGTFGMDHPTVGRLMSQTQWANAFGVSHRAAELSLNKTDAWKAWADAKGGEEGPCLPCTNTFEYMRQAVALMQWAGPNLNPFTIERGAFSAPQLNGWSNPKRWPGWKCCNPAALQWKFGPNDYTAVEDLKEVWWDPEANDPIDGRPGTYHCNAKCRRFSFGNWTKGEPVPGKPRP